MIGGEDLEALLARFRAWLERARADTASPEGDSAPTVGDFSGVSPLARGASASGAGLLELVREFTALRHEVKLQTKSSRSLEECAAQALAALDEAAAQFRGVEPREAAAADRAAEPFVEALVELDEAVERGRAAVENARRRIEEKSADAFAAQWEELAARLPYWKRRLCRAWLRDAQDLGRRQAAEMLAVLDSLQDGYAMLRNRLQKILVQREIARIDCLGEPADPHCVTVVEAVEDSDRLPGTVVEILRPGYLWKGAVFRFAEVRAVRG